MNLFELAAVLTLDSKGYDQGLKDAEKDASSFGSKLKSTLGTVGKVGGAIVGTVGAVAAGTTKKLLDSSSQVAEMADHIDKQSQKIGISAKAYQEWDFILTHNGASVDSLQTSMKTLSTQAEKNADEFAALGISQEELATLGTEELFERVVKGLQGMEQGTERTAIASKLLGRGATELAPVLNSTADDIEDMRKQAHDLGKVLSDEAVKSGAAYEDSLYNLQTAMGGIKNQMASNLLPSLVTVMDGLTGIFAGDDSAIEKVSEGLETLVVKVGEAIPKIAETASKILPKLIEAISKNVSPLVRGATQLITKLAKELPKIVTPIIQAIPGIIKDIAKSIAEDAPALIGGVVDMVTALVVELPNILLAVAEALPDILKGIFNGIVDNLPQLIAGVSDLIDGLIKALPGLLAGIVNTVGGLVTDLILAIFPFGEKFKKMFEGFDFGGFVGGVFGEVAKIAGGIFQFIGTLFDDPAQALKDAFDGVKSYAEKVFQSIGDIVKGVFELLYEEQVGQYIRKAQHSGVDKQVEEAMKLGWTYEKDENGYWTKTGYLPGTEAERISLEYATKEAEPQKVETTVNHTGTITVEGKNDGEVVEAYQVIVEQVKKEVRMGLGG
jgi:phage-related protein